MANMANIEQEETFSVDCENTVISGDAVSFEANHRLEIKNKIDQVERENDSAADEGEASEAPTPHNINKGIILGGSKDGQHLVDGDYGYEEAAPEVQRRNRDDRHFRRNSLVGRIMVWAGMVNDEHFSNRTGSMQEIRQAQRGTNRRASMDGSMNETSGPQSTSVSRRRRCSSSDDIDLLDHEDGEGDDPGDFYEEGYGDRAHRRNSLHAMVERAMAYVNMERDDIDDDLSPFGNRRDSLFS